MNIPKKYILFIIITIILLLLLLIFAESLVQNSVTESLVQKKQEYFDNKIHNIEIVIARYNEDLRWLNDDPFNQYNYIVYNKGVNSDFLKTPKFKEEIKLENVGREVHTYLTHIIDNYDKLADFTFFVPGSLELQGKNERATRLFNAAGNDNTSDLLACLDYHRKSDYDFKIDNYLSSSENNKILNDDVSMKKSDIRPYGKWYEATFNNENVNGNCYTANSMFGLTRETIIKKPKEYYMKLIQQVNEHHNHETVHYFERSWETVFYPYSDVKAIL